MGIVCVLVTPLMLVWIVVSPLEEFALVSEVYDDEFCVGVDATSCTRVLCAGVGEIGEVDFWGVTTLIEVVLAM